MKKTVERAEQSMRAIHQVPFALPVVELPLLLAELSLSFHCF